MFNFLSDMYNYEDRCVALFDDGEGIRISTARCSDGSQPYETAIQHPDYNDGDYVIVEAYMIQKKKPRKLIQNGLHL